MSSVETWKECHEAMSEIATENGKYVVVPKTLVPVAASDVKVTDSKDVNKVKAEGRLGGVGVRIFRG